MVEVKTGKSKETLPILITQNKNTQPLLGWIGWITWKLDYKETKTRTLSDISKQTEDNRRS